MTFENKRVYELAKEYGMSNKEFIEYIDKKLDIKVKSHSSNISPAQIDKIKALFSQNKEKDTNKKPKAFIIKKAKTIETKEEKEEKSKEKEEQTKKSELKEIKEVPQEQQKHSEETARNDGV